MNLAEPHRLKSDTAFYAGLSGSSLVTAAQFLPWPFSLVASAVIPFGMAALLWYAPFIQIRFQIRTFQKLSDSIELQLKLMRLSEGAREGLLVVLEEANKRVIELQFALYPPGAESEQSVLVEAMKASLKARLTVLRQEPQLQQLTLEGNPSALGTAIPLTLPEPTKD